MAITSARIQVRRGLEKDFNPDEMTPGEWALSTDTKYIRMCIYPGLCLRMATYEAFEQDMQQIQSIISEARTIQEAINRINTEVSSNAQAVAEYTAQAKQYRDEAKQFRDEASALANVGIATETVPGLMAGGDNSISEDGKLLLTKTTTDRTLLKSHAGGLKLNRVDGESQQKKYSGKNKLNIADATYTALKTWSIDLPAGTYTVSCDITSSDTDATQCLLELFVVPNNYTSYHRSIKFNRGKTVFTFTTTETIKSMYLWASASATASSGDTVTLKNFMIVEGEYTIDTIGDFEPYVGSTASPNPLYPQDIKSVVVEEIIATTKNLFTNTAVNKTVNGLTFKVNDDKSVTVTGTATAETYYRCASYNSKKGQRLTLSNSVGGDAQAYYEGVNGSPAWMYGGTHEITVPSTIYYGIYVEKGAVVNKTFYPQIVLDGQDSTYIMPKKSSIQLSAPITLRGNSGVKDIICKQDGMYGVLPNIGESTFVGNANESWEIDAQVTNYIRFKIKVENSNSAATRTFCLCNRAIFDSSGHSAGVCFINAGYFYIYINQSITTIADLKTWLASNNVVIQYPLATSNFKPLPLADQIALHQLETFDTVTHISTDSEIEPVMEVEYGTSVVGSYLIKTMNSEETNRLKNEQLEAMILSLSNAVLESEV